MSYDHCATYVELLHGQDSEVGSLSERVVRIRDEKEIKKNERKKEGKCTVLNAKSMPCHALSMSMSMPCLTNWE